MPRYEKNVEYGREAAPLSRADLRAALSACAYVCLSVGDLNDVDEKRLALSVLLLRSLCEVSDNG